EKAFSTIVDANVTTLITSFILIYFGTGPVKGFGVTLAIGIGATMFCALIVGRVFLDLLVNTGMVKRMLTVSLFKEFNFQFLNYRKYAFIGSWLLVAIGVSSAIIHHQKILGIDFTGGDEVALYFEKDLTLAEVQTVATELGVEEVSLTRQTPLTAGAQTVIKISTPFEQGQVLYDGLAKAYPEKGLTEIGINKIGPAVGKSILLDALIALGLSLVCILGYIALRFEFGFGVGAVVATVHDLLMTIGIFVMFGNEFSAPMVAALLMIVGYSLNDTIVVFDRIREELDLNPGLKLKQVVHLAINRTLSRTLLTSLTTLLVTISLLIFGTGVIRDFAFTFVVGIITGTLSSIFIASPVFYWWHKGDRHHAEAHADIMPKYEWKSGSKSNA
ncbi:MAG: protein translocase subunit SecF, partial [Verrucomicrobiae bacterium]|nr:protein translocase subunit SecF [Verrucomicrobiae bacterium]